MIEHQHPTLLARCRQPEAKKAAQVHDRQQPPTQVGHPADPGFYPGNPAQARLMQDFGDLAHGRDEPLLADAKANTAPALQAGFLQRQIGRQQPAAPVNVQQQLEGRQRLAHGLGGQPLSTPLSTLIRVSSSTGLVR
ncbi:hypothetical protein D3C80_1476630 [compost metagenome]